jgi:hypothetical protein
MPSTGLPLLHQSVPDNARRLGNSCWEVLLVVEGCVVLDGSVGGVGTTKGCMEKGELVTGRTKRANRHRISMGWLVGCIFFRRAAPLVGIWLLTFYQFKLLLLDGFASFAGEK